MLHPGTKSFCNVVADKQLRNRETTLLEHFMRRVEKVQTVCQQIMGKSGVGEEYAPQRQ